MAKETTKSAADWKREYEELAKQASAFDAQTKKLVDGMDDPVKALLAKREAERKALMSRKLAAFTAMQKG